MRRSTIKPVALSCLMLAVGLSPVSAQGFFEQLFGAQPAPPLNAPSAVPDMPGFLPGMQPLPPRPKKRIVVEEKPVRQTPTDLMHDKTLRVGDAVMMKNGIHIYNGGGGATHTTKQFVALDTSRRVSSQERQRLADLDATRSDTAAEGRSATPISNGVQITDVQGRSMRYVGP